MVRLSLYARLCLSHCFSGGDNDDDDDDNDFGGGAGDDNFLGDADVPEPVEPMGMHVKTIISSWI